jgi:hypothetical protein
VQVLGSEDRSHPRAPGVRDAADSVTRQQSGRLKKAFLEHFRVYGNVTAACTAISVERSTAYKWLERDPDFAAAYKDAEIQATEVLEGEARRRAVEGVVTITPNYYRGELLSEVIETKYSDTLLIFLLKARAPEKYRETVRQEHSGPQGGPVVFTLKLGDGDPI